jgi:hypothetical protein
MQSDTSSCGWQSPDHTSLSKTFHFTSNDQLSEFLVGILTVEHDRQFCLNANESCQTKDISVSISGYTADTPKAVVLLVRSIDDLYLECCHAKQSFWKWR